MQKLHEPHIVFVLKHKQKITDKGKFSFRFERNEQQQHYQNDPP